MTRLWVLRLIPDAVRLAPNTFGLALALLASATALSISLSRLGTRWAAGAATRAAAGAALGWSVIAWALRDRLHVVGDAQLWLHSATALGFNTPGYREPLSIFLLILISRVTAPILPAAEALALVSVLCGAATFASLWRYARAASARLDSAAEAIRYAPLLYATPLALIYFGHIETYPLFTAGLAWTLVLVRPDLVRGRLRVRTGLALAGLGLLHFSGFFLLPSLLLVLVLRNRPAARWALPLSVAAVAVAGVVLSLWPGFRRESTLAYHWSPGLLRGYLLELWNGWALVLLPPAALWIEAARQPAPGPMGSFLGFAALSFLLLPLIGLFKLGLYRDLDLLSPAFVLLLFFLAEREALARPGWPARLALACGLGLPLLAALLSLNMTASGFAYFERRVEAAPLDPTHRVYGYEVLARVQRERHDLDGARASVRQAIELVPTNARLYGYLGELDLAAGDTVSATRNLERALVSNRATEVLVLLAGLELKRGNAARAIDLLRPARLATTVNARASAVLAGAYLAAGRPDSSLQVTTAWLTAAPNDARAHFQQAGALLALHHPVEALHHLEEAARLAPNDKQILVQRDRLRRESLEH